MKKSITNHLSSNDLTIRVGCVKKFEIETTVE